MARVDPEKRNETTDRRGRGDMTGERRKRMSN